MNKILYDDILPVRLENAPAFLVTGYVNNSLTPELLINGSTATPLIPYFIRATINPGDDVTAAARLKTGATDTQVINLNNSLDIYSDTPITDLYLVGIGNSSAVAAAPGSYSGSQYIIANTDTADANWLANMVHLTFLSTYAITRLVIEVSPILDTKFCNVKISGYAQ